MTTPSTRTILGTLQRPRLLELARSFSVQLTPDAAREKHIEALAASGHIQFRDLLGVLAREELKAACKQHGLDDSGRARAALAARLLQAHGAAEIDRLFALNAKRADEERLRGVGGKTQPKPGSEVALNGAVAGNKSSPSSARGRNGKQKRNGVGDENRTLPGLSRKD